MFINHHVCVIVFHQRSVRNGSRNINTMAFLLRKYPNCVDMCLIQYTFETTLRSVLQTYSQPWTKVGNEVE